MYTNCIKCLLNLNRIVFYSWNIAWYQIHGMLRRSFIYSLTSWATSQRSRRQNWQETRIGIVFEDGRSVYLHEITVSICLAISSSKAPLWSAQIGPRLCGLEVDQIDTGNWLSLLFKYPPRKKSDLPQASNFPNRRQGIEWVIYHVKSIRNEWFISIHFPWTIDCWIDLDE